MRAIWSFIKFVIFVVILLLVLCVIFRNWVVKNLVDCSDPRLHGKALTGSLKGIWRYRVGDYRLFADIRDNVVTVFIFEVAHRSEIYNQSK